MDALVALQRWIYDSIGGFIGSFAVGHDWGALLAVLPLGVIFGAIHAMTPGHSKLVLASYLAGARLAAFRSIAVASVLSLTHVGSAVIFAFIAAPLFTRTLGNAGRAPSLEILSRGSLLLIALWLLWRAWRGRPHASGEGITVGAAAGLVPCPLTLFVMFAALARGVPQAGLAFAVAMMLGIAMTLWGVALATVLARESIARLVQHAGASIARVSRALDAMSALLLLAVAAYELLPLLVRRH